jgi:RHS repeat-associated protein
VVDNGNDTFGFKESPSSSSADHYTYDVNGNMTSDSHKGISSITYNHLNLPTSLAINENDFITYVYDANGVKQAKYVVEDGLNVTTTEYAGNYVYQTIGAGNTYLQFFNHAEGYVKSILDESDGSYDYEYIYQYKDHLGSVRLSYSDTNGDGYISGPDDRFNPNEIIEESNYYPFGLKQRGYNTYTSSNGNSVAQRWGYTGKEHQTEVGLAWIDITARNYDAALGRWMNIDILSEKYMDLSPYNYSLNDPILYVDPDGETPLLGAILGAFTEYAGIVGSKMLFDNMSFVEANKDLGWRDGLDIGIAAGFGAVSGALDGGITKFAAWISKGKNQKIVKLLLETAVSAIESSLKAIYKDEDFDLKSILSGALAEVGLGNLLKNDVIKKSAKKNKKKADLAKDRAADLEKRRSPNKKLIDKAKKEASSHSRTAKSLDNLNNTGEAIRDTTKKVVANEVQERTKEEDED